MAGMYRIRASISAVGISKPCLFTTYWDAAGGTPAQVVTEALARVRAFWNSFAPTMANGCVLAINPVGDLIDDATGALVGQDAGTPPAAVAFAGSGDPLPFATQALVRLSTAAFINGRRLQGHMNIPYLVESDSTSGFGPNAGTVTALQNAANLLGTTVVTPISQRVWHRPNPVTHTGGNSQPVIARTVSTKWATLRSRRG